MNDDYKNLKWPVRYDEHPDIWEAWEVLRKGTFGVPPIPLGQFIVTREKNFYPLDGSAYFYEGYKYYWVDYDSGKWDELTQKEFQNCYLDYEYRVDSCGRIANMLNFAYSAIKPPAYPRNYTYQNYINYLRSYYPDYIEDDVCAVFVHWSKDRRPLVQIRQKCGNKWDMVYPGGKEYVPLWKFYWHNLEDFGRDFGEVEQIYPRECFVCQKKLFTPKKEYYIPSKYNIVNILNGNRRNPHMWDEW